MKSIKKRPSLHIYKESLFKSPMEVIESLRDSESSEIFDLEFLSKKKSDSGLTEVISRLTKTEDKGIEICDSELHLNPNELTSIVQDAAAIKDFSEIEHMSKGFKNLCKYYKFRVQIDL